MKAVEFSVNKLEGDVRSSIAIPTGEIETIETGLVIKSVGYRSLPVEVFRLIRAVAWLITRGEITDSDGKEVRLN